MAGKQTLSFRKATILAIFLVTSGIIALPMQVLADISCNFSGQGSASLCGWVPRAHGAVWQVGDAAPPKGLTHYLYVRSGQESWASLESPYCSISQDAKFLFTVSQQRFQFDMQLVKLQMETSDGHAQATKLTELWSTDNTIGRGWLSQSVKIKSQINPIRLRFCFRIGTQSDMAGIAGLKLETNLKHIQLRLNSTDEHGTPGINSPIMCNLRSRVDSADPCAKVTR